MLTCDLFATANLLGLCVFEFLLIFGLASGNDVVRGLTSIRLRVNRAKTDLRYGLSVLGHCTAA